MYTESNNEKNDQPDFGYVPVPEPVGDEPAQNEPLQSAPIYSEPAQSAPVQNVPVQSEPLQSAPIYSEPVQNTPVHNEPLNSEPPHGEPLYSKPVHNEPMHSEPPIHGGPLQSNTPYSEPPNTIHPYSDQYNASWNMYSPSICTTRPAPRTRYNETVPAKDTHERNRRLSSFLRAVCLIVICSLLSGASAYFVMDYRFKRGDFAVTNQVVLGNGPTTAKQDSGVSAPVAALTEGISAQDIYDIARTQVVGIVTEAPGAFSDFDAQGAVTPVSGSGFIISGDGYILTNFHVIELAHTNKLPLNVILNDGTSYDAKVIGFESNSDVAVIKIDATGLNPAFIGDSGKIRVGQTIYAVGNPFGDLVYTMTDGIVSALDRPVTVEGKTIRTFQFSAAVNSGNSGGPIYDTNGEVIGIVTAKVIRGNVEGIGFAIPINDAIEIATELIEHGYISGRPLIGITAQTVSPGHADYYGWVVGAYIRSVAPDSAAESAGLAVGDIVISIGGEEIDSMEALKFALRSYKAGDTTTITVWRNGEVIELSITFDEDLSAGQPQRTPVPEPDSPNPFEDLP